MLTRRAFALVATAATLSSCVRGSPGGGAAGPRDPALLPQPNAGFDAWVSAFRGRAAARGIPAGTIDAAFRGVGFLPGVVERDRNQTEFRRSFEDYLAIVAPEEKVAVGRAALARQRGTLAAIEGRYGVPAAVVAAIWGVESYFGQRRGDIPTISAVSTLAYDGRRGDFFEGQLVAALRILAAGDVAPERMVGSWAGAMGHTQFIPTSYLQSAVDFDGDGRRDIWSEDPTDALTSAAAYLAGAGWVRGGAIAAEDPAGNLTPDAGGPSFRTGPNFLVVKRYNNSDSYALGVAYLAGRLAGGGPLRQGFGPDRFGLTIGDRQDLQRRLMAAGFDTGGTDGVIGPRSRAAIAAFQRSRGLAATGDPSAALLAALR